MTSRPNVVLDLVLQLLKLDLEKPCGQALASKLGGEGFQHGTRTANGHVVYILAERHEVQVVDCLLVGLQVLDEHRYAGHLGLLFFYEVQVSLDRHRVLGVAIEDRNLEVGNWLLKRGSECGGKRVERECSRHAAWFGGVLSGGLMCQSVKIQCVSAI